MNFRNIFKRNIFKRKGATMEDPKHEGSVPVEPGKGSKYTCSFCGNGCDVAYAGLKSVAFMGGMKAAHHTHACADCYRKQRKELYPDETSPV